MKSPRFTLCWMAIENVYEDVTFNLRHNNKRDQSYKDLGGGVGKGSKIFYEDGTICSMKRENSMKFRP